MLIWSPSDHLVSMAVIAMAIGFGAFGNNEINMCISEPINNFASRFHRIPPVLLRQIAHDIMTFKTFLSTNIVVVLVKIKDDRTSFF